MATIIGTEGVDSKTGTGVSDRISGLGGNDTLRGLGGDDWLQGGLGNDGLHGGAGSDTASYLDATGSIVANLVFGTSSGNRGIDAFSSIENLEGGAFADTLLGAPGDNRLWGRGAGDFLYGQLGNDWLQGGPGNDIVDGGPDFDTASYLDATGGITASLETGTSSGNRGSDTLISIERLEGSNFADTLTGGFETPVQLWGRGGNDALQALNLDTELDGGPGNDHLFGLSRSMVGGSGNDRLEGGTFTLDGGTGDDYLIGGEFFNSVLIGGPGRDWLDGADDIDTASYETERSAVRVDLAAGTAVTASGTDRLANIENVEGSDGGDTLKGDDRDNGLSGEGLRFQDRPGAGNDLIEGRGGNDQLYGGLGADRIYGGDGDDGVVGGEGNDVIKGGSGHDFLTGGENSHPDLSQSGDDRMDGGSGDDSLRSGNGDDVLIGGSGRDFFFIETATFDDNGFVIQWPPGKDIIVDFERGRDSIGGALEFADNSAEFGGFEAFDSNSNGRLDDADRYVAVRNVTFEGATARSTVIDIGAFGETVVGNPYAPGSDTLTLFGVASVSATDFA